MEKNIKNIENIELCGKYTRKWLRDKLHDFEDEIKCNLIHSIRIMSKRDIGDYSHDEYLDLFYKNYESDFHFCGNDNDHSDNVLLEHRDNVEISFILPFISASIMQTIVTLYRKFSYDYYCVAFDGNVQVILTCDYLRYIVDTELFDYHHIVNVDDILSKD